MSRASSSNSSSAANVATYPITVPITCSVFVGTSVDGFIARRDGSLDWLPPGGGEEHGYTSFLATVDAIVMGRGTFETVIKFDRWPFQKPVIVLTASEGVAKAPPGACVE